MSIRLVLAFAAALALAAAPVWHEATPGYHYQFPRDHFEHQDFRTEWWYYTGNVVDAHGKRFGFELVFFRQGELPNNPNPSVWAITDLYLAHAALTDIDGKRFWYEERPNRQGPGIAGASFEKRRFWNGNWQAQWNGDHQELDAIADDFRFHLDLKPVKPPVINGEKGLSVKADGPGRASYYVSFPRLAVNGKIRVGTDEHAVTGQAWMDHEWFTEQLSSDQQGWDWFSVQFDNNTELMLFDLRRKDGSLDAHSSGTFVDVSGHARHLKQSDFTLTPLRKFGKYPVEWRIEIPSLKVNVTCRAALDNQELRSKNGGPNYWEGAVTYDGTNHGVGYLEMTGYEGAVHF
ncbi:MAG TPA: lipocalin-like domain-containing protein [Bryobacteraceae bacterium]|nr:lipocalin-like domain-containing protein [Bryobacteraceae bacterium]